METNLLKGILHIMLRNFNKLLVGMYTIISLPGFRVALVQRLKNAASEKKKPNEIFSGVNDLFWYWLNTEGYRTTPELQRILPGMPAEDVQLMYTGTKGDAVMWEGFIAYTLFKGLYEKHVGPIGESSNILDFGCGWGRIIRFFLKDLDPSKILGCDPVEKMIEICKEQNKWCNFTQINTRPPSPYADNTFDLIYSFSVFSHLSEEMSDLLLGELTRILKPGGMLIVTTRSRDFIVRCAGLRKSKDLASLNAGSRSSADAFLNTEESLRDYDNGSYCFSQLVHEGEWSYWGDAAISKKYVLEHWTKSLDFVDYVDDQKQIVQNAIVLRKPLR